MGFAALLVLGLMTAQVVGQAPGQDQGEQSWTALTRAYDSLRPPAKIGRANNAAGAYLRTWDSLPMADLRSLGTAAAEVADAKALTPERRALLARHSSYIDSLIAASATPDCDWGMAYEQGWDVLLPHLGQMRQTARILRADAIRCVSEGSMIAAVERVRAMLRVSVHAAENGVLISTLVGIAIGAQATDTAHALLDSGKMTPAQARMLLAGFREVPRKDFYNVGLAVENERQVTLRWLPEKCRGENAGMDFCRLLGGMHIGLDPFLPTNRLNEQQFMEHLARADRYYQELSKAWLRDDGGARLEELELELREYQHGLVAVSMAPSMGRARRSVLDLQARFSKMEAGLEALAGRE
jgi:hypothetical protein